MNENEFEHSEINVSEQVAIRMAKLAELRAAGRSASRTGTSTAATNATETVPAVRSSRSRPGKMGIARTRITSRKKNKLRKPNPDPGFMPGFFF